MTPEQLKLQLNPELVVDILNSLKCHNIKVYKDTIKACNPNGDNPNAINIYLDNYFTDDFTRSEFQSLPYKDIITLVGFFLNISSQESIKYICDICKFDYYTVNNPRPQCLEWLDFIETGIKEEEEEELIPLPNKILEQFIIKPNKKWKKENISIESQIEYQIGFDLFTARITIPIYDELGNLVGVKGRLFYDRDINNDKYIYIYSCPKTKILYGLHKNYKHIKESNEVIVVESEKSVIKLHSFGYKNVVAVGSKNISSIQLNKLLRLCVPITLALDKDVTNQELDSIIKKFKSSMMLNKLYIIKDIMDLLNKHDSPCDCMDTWEMLYKYFKLEV